MKMAMTKTSSNYLAIVDSVLVTGVIWHSALRQCIGSAFHDGIRCNVYIYIYTLVLLVSGGVHSEGKGTVSVPFP